MYYWQVRANESCAPGNWSETWKIETAGCSPDAITQLADKDYYLDQNYSNPFMETTTIEFNLPIGSRVNLVFFDLQGKIVETFTKYYIAGKHSFEFNAKGKVQSGVYIYRMRTMDFTDTKLCVVR